MRIVVDNEPWRDEDDMPYYQRDFKANHAFELPEDANAVTATNMFLQACLAEGFSEESVLQALYEVALSGAAENKFVILGYPDDIDYIARDCIKEDSYELDRAQYWSRYNLKYSKSKEDYEKEQKIIKAYDYINPMDWEEDDFDKEDE